jgi:hypothetical protein
MEAKKAHKVQNTNGVKGNRTVPKENFVNRHKKSTPKGVIDTRIVKVEIRLVHPRRSVMVKTIEMYQIEAERSKWAKDGWELFINN